MPLGQNNLRGPGMQNIQYYAITDNPVFKVKIRSLATNVEQKPNSGRQDYETDYTQKFKVGDYIKGKSIKNEKTYSGKIIKIEKNEKGQGTALIIIDKDSKERIKLDPTTCFKKDISKSNNYNIEELPFFGDSLDHVLNYSDYLLNKS